MKIALVDVSRAHFYAPSVRPVFVQLLEEDPESQNPGVCGRLDRTMYGTLDAAEQWSLHYSKVLLQAGFRQGKASPCHFYHSLYQVRILVHGDDFVIVGRRAGRQYAEQVLGNAYDIKTDYAGLEANDPIELKVLGRVLIFHEWGVSVEADPSLI